MFGHDLHHLEVGDFHAIVAHTAWQALSFDYTRSKGGVTHGTRGTQPVMLTVRLASDTCEAIPFDNTLKTVALRGPYGIQKITFGKHILNTNFFAELGNAVELCAEVTKLNHSPLGCGISFLEVTYQRLGCVLFFLLSEGQLQSRIPVSLSIFYLSDDAGPCLDDCARDILTVLAIYARHPNFTS
jgi:hypothetical protein